MKTITTYQCDFCKNIHKTYELAFVCEQQCKEDAEILAICKKAERITSPDARQLKVKDGIQLKTFMETIWRYGQWKEYDKYFFYQITGFGMCGMFLCKHTKHILHVDMEEELVFATHDLNILEEVPLPEYINVRSLYMDTWGQHTKAFNRKSKEEEEKKNNANKQVQSNIPW